MTFKRKKLNDVNFYLKKKNINNDLQIKIRNYVEYIHEEEINGYYKGKKLMENISSNLKKELAIDGFGKILKNISFLKNHFSEEFINKLCIEGNEATLVTNEILVIILLNI